MEEFHITKEIVELVLETPDSVLDGQFGRKIFQRRNNGYMLRTIVELEEGIKRVITVYLARSTRYEI